MSGFALLYNLNYTVQEPDFSDFLESAAGFKCLEKNTQYATGNHCIAAKLESPTSLHRGVFVDDATGSWMLAAGTVIDQTELHSDWDLLNLLQDYLKQGDEIFKRIDGHFALVIYDRPADKTVIVSDPFGTFSIFYGRRKDQFFISTSALAVAKAIQSKPSDLGTHYFLINGTVLGEMTIWQDVKRMLPATVLTLNSNGVNNIKYWSFIQDYTITKLSLDEAVDLVIDVLTRALRHCLSQDRKVWLSLTGGFDSRTLAALAYYANIPFKAYCHGQPDSKDVHISSILSEKMGWEYEYFPLPEDWGQQRPSWFSQTLGLSDGHLSVLKTSRIVREQTLKALQYGVSLWGFGGEIYRGYYWKQEFLNLGNTSKIDYEHLLDYRLNQTMEWSLIKDSASWTKLTQEALKKQLIEIGEENPDWLNTIKLDMIGKYLEHSWSGAHISTVQGLQRVLSPFDFKENATCIFSLNYIWRKNGKLFKYILERINPILVNTEMGNGGPAISMRPTNMYKFIPFWFGQGQELLWRLGHKYVGKDLWKKKDPGKEGVAWPVDRWRKDTLSNLDKSILTFSKMRSASLYDKNDFHKITSQALDAGFKYEELLGRVITVEMALQSIGTSF